MYRLLLQQRQAQVMFEFNRRNPNKPMHGLSAGVQSEFLSNGGNALVLRGQVIGAPQPLPEPVPVPVPPSCSIEEQFQYALSALFTYNAANNVPPTRCTRIYYLWFASVAQAYNWVTAAGAVTGVKDSWNWDTSRAAAPLSEGQVYVWMTRVLIRLLETFAPGTPLSPFLERERNTFRWDEGQQAAAAAATQAAGSWDSWLAAWDGWWAGRAADGNVAAGTPPTDVQQPNGATTLDVTVTQNFTDAVAYPQVSKWTPLKVGGAKRGYLTYGWENVTSTCLSAWDETTVKSAAQGEMLTDDTARAAEIDALKEVVTTLTDRQKVIAEFWAGGPFTVAPPGMCIWFWAQHCVLTGQPLRTRVYSGLDLAVNLFEGSRITWALKRWGMEARPIQEIRRRYAGQTLTSYTGAPVAAALWMPFQLPNFVTPPFPDFPSGHSTFSQCFANVMTDWFGAAVPAGGFKTSELALLCPMMGGEREVALTRFEIPAGSSEIQPGAVPAAPVALEFTSWQDMADQAGVSRQYGGIHAASAHLGGQAVANGLHGVIKSAWGIAHS